MIKIKPASERQQTVKENIEKKEKPVFPVVKEIESQIDKRLGSLLWINDIKVDYALIDENLKSDDHRDDRVFIREQIEIIYTEQGYNIAFSHWGDHFHVDINFDPEFDGRKDPFYRLSEWAIRHKKFSQEQEQEQEREQEDQTPTPRMRPIPQIQSSAMMDNEPITNKRQRLIPPPKKPPFGPPMS